MTVHVLLPARDEETGIAAVIDAARAQIRAAGMVPAFVVVDDGSRDATAARAAGDDVTVLTQPPSGIPAAFAAGLRHILSRAAADDLLVLMEADHTSEAQLLPALLARGSAGSDVVIASRHVRGGAYRNFPLARRLLSLGANRLFRLVWRLPGVTDYTIFFRCYRVALLQRALPSPAAVVFRHTGFAANIELLGCCCRAGATVAEVPHVYCYGRKPGPSKMRVLPNLAAHLRLLFDRSCR